MTRYAVTGSSGHLGEALVRVLRGRGASVVGIDLLDSPWTDVAASITDRAALRAALAGADHVLHTATLHKPHLGTHSRQDFVDTNVTGTLAVLEATRDVGARSIVVTSSTSAFGRALTPERGEPAVWIDEDVPHRVRNVYGATKTAAEDLAELAAADGLPAVVLRTSRFFPEADDRDTEHHDTGLKVQEFTYRRVDLADVVEAHLLAAERAPALGFGKYVVSGSTPYTPADAGRLGVDAAGLFRERFPALAAAFDERGWALLPRLDRVYDNTRARTELGWSPRHDVGSAARRALADGDPRSDLARTVGAKGYHAEPTGVYTR